MGRVDDEKDQGEEDKEQVKRKAVVVVVVPLDPVPRVVEDALRHASERVVEQQREGCTES